VCQAPDFSCKFIFLACISPCVARNVSSVHHALQAVYVCPHSDSLKLGYIDFPPRTHTKAFICTNWTRMKLRPNTVGPLHTGVCMRNNLHSKIQFSEKHSKVTRGPPGSASSGKFPQKTMPAVTRSIESSILKSIITPQRCNAMHPMARLECFTHFVVDDGHDFRTAILSPRFAFPCSICIFGGDHQHFDQVPFMT
jgi:hypothetical protein